MRVPLRKALTLAIVLVAWRTFEALPGSAAKTGAGAGATRFCGGGECFCEGGECFLTARWADSSGVFGAHRLDFSPTIESTLSMPGRGMLVSRSTVSWCVGCPYQWGTQWTCAKACPWGCWSQPGRSIRCRHCRDSSSEACSQTHRWSWA